MAELRLYRRKSKSNRYHLFISSVNHFARRCTVKYRDHIAISVHIHTHTPSVFRVDTIKDHNQSIVTNLFVTITHRDSEHDWLHPLLVSLDFTLLRLFLYTIFVDFLPFLYSDLECNLFPIFCFVSFLERAICFSLFFFFIGNTF